MDTLLKLLFSAYLMLTIRPLFLEAFVGEDGSGQDECVWIIGNPGPGARVAGSSHWRTGALRVGTRVKVHG